MTDPHDILSQVIKQQAPELLNYSNKILLTMGGKNFCFSIIQTLKIMPGISLWLVRGGRGGGVENRGDLPSEQLGKHVWPT